jgi:tetratricopeptide (TPR) repeat protein
MKKILLVFLFSILASVLWAQHREDAENLVAEGVILEDSGKSEMAITKYQQALDLNKDDLMALSEMAYSLLSVEKYGEAVKFCKRALKTHKGEQGLKTVYVGYANALDALKEPANALAVYNEGIKIFPEYYQLYFNKGIMLAGLHKNDEALLCLERSAALNPDHAGSQNAMANLLLTENKRIPAMMAYCRFLVIEPKSKRSAAVLENLQGIMKGNISASGKDSLTVTLNPDLLASPDNKEKPNNFSTVEFALSMASVLDYDSTIKNKTAVEKFVRKFEMVISSMKEAEKDNYGFYWDFYVPFFLEMKEKNFIETFAYIVFASSGDPDVTTWLSSHKESVRNFYEWSDAFKWRIN